MYRADPGCGLADRVVSCLSRTELSCIVASRSTKQIAKDLALEGWDLGDIADRLSRPLRTVKDWLEV